MRNNDWVGKRSSARQNCQMRGEMRFLDGRPPLECLIVDISASGCRIQLDTAFDCPEDFDLFIPSRSETKIGKVRRQDGVHLGVAFLKSRLDDPLVMQTLLERVARLERGYSELKGFVAPAAVVEKRGTSELTPGKEPFPAPVETGPMVEHRLKALAEGLQDLRSTVDRIVATPVRVAGSGEDGEGAAGGDIDALKTEMASLAKAIQGAARAVPDVEAQGAEIVDLKAEMSKLSLAMRNLAAEMPKTSQAGQSSGANQQAAGADTMAFAKMKADIAQLRAAVDELESTGAGAEAKTVVVTSGLLDDVAGMKAEMSALGEAMRQMTATAYEQAPTFSADLAHMKAEMLKLSISMRDMAQELPKVQAVAATAVAAVDPALLAGMKADIAQLRAAIDEIDIAVIGDGHGARTTVLAADVAGLKSEMSALGEAMRLMTDKAYAEAPNFSADLAHMKAEMLKLSISMRELSTELPMVQAIAARGDVDQARMEKLAAEIDRIWKAIDILPATGAATGSGDARLKQEVATLRDALHRGLEELRAAIDELDATATDEAGAARATVLASDVASLKSEMTALGEAMRRATGKAYEEAPNFSADLAHMKAEMLKLSISMREMAQELPRVEAVAATAAAAPAADAAQLAKIKADIAQLRLAMETRAPGASSPAVEDARSEITLLREEIAQLRAAASRAAANPAPAAPADEVADLRDSVQALILLVSQSLASRDMAA